MRLPRTWKRSRVIRRALSIGGVRRLLAHGRLATSRANTSTSIAQPRNMSLEIRTAAKQLLGPRLTTVARVLSRGGELPQWGNLRRTEPFSDAYGFDRGTPIDRFYLERFLAAERSVIRGAVLEIQVNSYTKQFGH